MFPAIRPVNVSPQSLLNGPILVAVLNEEEEEQF